MLYPLDTRPSLPFTEFGVAPLLSCGSVVVICGDCGRWPTRKSRERENSLKMKHSVCERGRGSEIDGK